MDYKKFVDEKVQEISNVVKGERALNLLSGGVDSSVVTMLGYEALGDDLISYFIDDFFRKKDEYVFVRDTFSKVGIDVHLLDIKEKMLFSLESISDNNRKRPFFKNVFYKESGRLMEVLAVEYIFQGTNKADIEMYDRGQDQHNVGVPFEVYGINNVIEPLVGLYKNQIREVARLVGLPKEIIERPPFPGPGLLIRCLGEITREKIEIIREAQEIVEQEMDYLKPFQTLVAISGDLVCSMIDRSVPDKYILFVRGVKSKDALTAKAIVPSRKVKNRLEERLMDVSDKIGRIVWDTTNKPPGTIEYI